MKRFIDLGNQTGNIDYDSGEREFAFYDTVRDCFETFGGSQTWTCIEDFIKDYSGNELDRYLILIPNIF
ncbi:hypothetical protein [Paludibacter sp.]|uniref:hypothetical protein n=1 Tax=Paludibacter sp. TaxID=1898105 RepID=UPI001353E033|nr:hypothetical protein [Paludibacter sp.]MTK53286.1 hypothetical protein [Paludibacter sp.]